MLWEHYEELVIATAMLLGCEPVYDDFGHPERAKARQYWTCQVPNGKTIYGHTRAECARKWLRAQGYLIDTRTGQVERFCHPTFGSDP